MRNHGPSSRTRTSLTRNNHTSASPFQLLISIFAASCLAATCVFAKEHVFCCRSDHLGVRFFTITLLLFHLLLLRPTWLLLSLHTAINHLLRVRPLLEAARRLAPANFIGPGLTVIDTVIVVVGKIDNVSIARGVQKLLCRNFFLG